MPLRMIFSLTNRNVGTKLMEEAEAVPQRMCTSPYHHRHTRLSTICCKFPEKRATHDLSSKVACVNGRCC